MTTLLEKAIDVSRKYVRSLLYVDNHIYNEPKINEEKAVWVRPESWVAACAKREIAACLYELAEDEGRKAVEALLPRTDICIIDWKMPAQNAKSKDEAVSVDPDMAKALLQEYISLARSVPGPRLLCILTLDDSNARKFVEEQICCDKKNNGVYTIKDTAVKIVVVRRDPEKYKNLPIIRMDVREKVESVSPNADEKGELSDSSSSDEPSESNTAITTAEDEETQIGHLLEYLVQEYAEMHKGIVPTFLLMLLTNIRDRTPELMKWFSSELDCAYVLESALSAYPEYAPAMLTKAIADAMITPFQYQREYETLIKDVITAWCKENDGGNSTKILCEGEEIEIGLEDRIRWLSVGYEKFFREKIKDKISRKKFERDSEQLIRAAESCCKHIDASELEVYCAKYAQLCDRKQRSADNTLMPMIRLSTGSVVSEKGTSDRKKYYVCLQQGCDSLRIGNGESRNFFFLPLLNAETKDGGIPLCEGSNVLMLQPSRRVYDIVVFKFKRGDKEVVSSKRGDKEDGAEFVDVCAKKKDNVYIFEGTRLDNKPVELKWEFDLKKDVAMKIADDFAHQFSRVAVDGSEWLRLKGKNLAPLDSEAPISVNAEQERLGDSVGAGNVELGS